MMVALQVAQGDAVSVVRGLAAAGLLGASVTAPLKETVLAACDELAPAAAAIGAVNCLAFVDHKVVGHNTDAEGFVRGLMQRDVLPTGGSALVLGAGGAARAIAYGLTPYVAPVVVARNPSQVTWCKALPWQADVLARECARTQLVVDCTSASGSAASLAAFVGSVPLALTPENCVVAGLNYAHASPLQAAAQALGRRWYDGRAMLVHQGVLAQQRWLPSHPIWHDAAMVRALTVQMEDALVAALR